MSDRQGRRRRHKRHKARTNRRGRILRWEWMLNDPTLYVETPFGFLEIAKYRHLLPKSVGGLMP